MGAYWVSPETHVPLLYEVVNMGRGWLDAVALLVTPPVQRFETYMMIM